MQPFATVTVTMPSELPNDSLGSCKGHRHAESAAAAVCQQCRVELERGVSCSASACNRNKQDQVLPYEVPRQA